MRSLSFILLLTAGVLSSGCFEQGDCQNQTSNKVKIDFFDAVTRKALTLAVDSVTIEGLPGKLYKAVSVNSITVPLNPLQDATEIMIHRNPAADATLILRYTARTTVLDPACGATELFTLSGAEGQPFQQAILVQKVLANVITTNVRLFF
ncbi:MAG: hypothetical protein ACKOAR_06795 [Bacteroidota bacterium]